MLPVKDNRDPSALGETLLVIWDAWKHTRHKLSWVADRAILRVPDYVSPEHPHEKYGDPRILPSTLPN